MPREFLRKYLPDHQRLRQNKQLQLFGDSLIDVNLWHINRRSASRAVSIGFFTCLLPVPMQMLLAALIAIVMRANLPLSVLSVWISNPLTMPPFFYMNYKVGAYLLNIPPTPVNIELSWAWLGDKVAHIWQPLLLGSLICAVIASLIGYCLTRFIWRLWVIRNWRKRRDKQL